MQRVHNKYKGTAPAGSVYIGRGSPYGNNFVIGKDGTRDDVCDKFERDTLPKLDLTPLIGKHVICFCHPQRCHGDSIIAAVKRLEAERCMTMAGDEEPDEAPRQPDLF